MTIIKKSDVKNHVARPQKKGHYLTPSKPEAAAGETGQESVGGIAGSAVLPGEREPVLVTKK